MPAFSIRRYDAADEPDWLRCRLLSFFESSYYDDVHTSKTVFSHPAVELVAHDRDGLLVGVLDIEIADDAATIDVIAVMPEGQGRGVATALLEAALPVLPRTVTTLDARTREDLSANRWYERRGFTVEHRYLHVYAGEGDSLDGFETPPELSTPVSAFLHARIEHAVEVRARFRRVHECRRYVRALGGGFDTPR